MAQNQSLHTKMLADSRMRDIKRRVEVIQKKVADLQDMGVPCAFCYSSVRNPGSIFTLGDKRITNVMEKYRNKILCNLMDGSHIPKTDMDSEIHLILPVLPAPLDELGRTTLLSMIVGILKDLDIRWSDPKPAWWPAEIPFVPPRSIPDNFSGNWISALKAILKSVYSYFSYDIDSYIASELESQSSTGNLDEPSLQGAPDECYSSDTDEGASYEQDSCHDESEECNTWGISGQNERLPTVNTMAPVPKAPSSNKAISSFTVENILMGKRSPASLCSSSTSTTSNHSPTSSAASLPSPTSLGPMPSSGGPMPSSGGPMSSSGGPMSSSGPSGGSSGPSGRPMSSSGPSGRPMSSSGPSGRPMSSSGGPMSSSGGPMSSLGPSGRPMSSSGPVSSSGRPLSSSGGPMSSSGGPMSSSIVGVNWVSHPPVKYTKFTILSPNAMSDEAKRKKFSEASMQSGGPKFDESAQLRKMPADYSNRKQPAQVYMRKTSSEASTSQMFPLSSLTSSSTRRASPTAITQYSTGKICTLPVVTSLQGSSSSSDGKVMLTKTFPPSQQYVLLVPSSSATATSSAQSVPRASLGLIQTGPSPAAMGSSIKTAFHSLPASTSSSNKFDLNNSCSSDDVRDERLERGRLNLTTSNLTTSNEYNFRLIAPKHKHVGSNSTGGRGKLRNRTSHKPQKLRFHMTTVVTKQKKIPVKSSMTVESPSVAVNNPPPNVNANTTRTVHKRGSVNCLPVESMITRSPNIYSSVPSKTVKVEPQDTESYASTRVEDKSKPPRNGLNASNNIEGGSLRNSKTGSPEDLHASRVSHRDVLEKPSASTVERPSFRTLHRGRATRSYTRRKRELTFHLYEEPFKAKRPCKE